MTYLDINCANCGPFHHTGQRTTTKCPLCGTWQIVVAPHDFEIDQRFKSERQRTEDDN